MQSISLRRILSFVVVLLIAAPNVADAQSGADRDRADLTDQKKERLNELIESARKDYQSEQYEDSIEDLKEAYQLYPNPAFFYRIALAYQNADQPERAIEYFEKFLDNKPDSSKRQEVEGRIAELEKQLEETGEEDPSDPSPRDTEDAQTDRTAASSSGGSGTGVSDPPDTGSGTASGPGAVPWIVGGIGGLGALSGITFGILSVSAKQRKDSVTSNDELTREEAREQGLIDRPQRFGTVALISGGVGVVGLGTAAILMFTGDNSGEAARALSPGTRHSHIGLSPVREGEGLLLRLEGDF